MVTVALALVLFGGTQRPSEDGGKVFIRSEPHVLIVGAKV
jgi:DNA replicative helicase MCM subunit Mcm2 (Cdc46/Mcm family)